MGLNQARNFAGILKILIEKEMKDGLVLSQSVWTMWLLVLDFTGTEDLSLEFKLMVLDNDLALSGG